jgi:hypothetical protein
MKAYTEIEVVFRFSVLNYSIPSIYGYPYPVRTSHTRNKEIMVLEVPYKLIVKQEGIFASFPFQHCTVYMQQHRNSQCMYEYLLVHCVKVFLPLN